MIQIFKDRLNKLRLKLEEFKLDAFLITKAENIRYLSGFTGGSDAKLLVSEKQNYIITDSRYTEQVKQQSPDWELIEQKPGQDVELSYLTRNYTKLGIESNISYKEFINLQKKVGDILVSTDNLIEELRMIKDNDELTKLRKSAQISDEVFNLIGNLLKPGITERYIANNISYYLKEKGCEKEAFDIIVVSGENAALPHGHPTNRILQKGDMVTMDYGGFFEGYAGDMTRTVAIDHATDKFKDYYMKVLEAQKLGVNTVRDGITAREVDAIVRNKLIEFGLGEYFNHGTGHGLGLEVHEMPSISLRSDIMLQENMVITIEPGIYIKGWGGIRIEDTVIVKKNGCEVITHSNKDLTIF